MLDFQKRIDYKGDLSEVMKLVCDNYQLGEYRKHSIILVGYEDFNLKLTTSQGNFFIKIFASFRSLEECQNYITVISRILEAGVAHPKLKKFADGVFWVKEFQGASVRLCVMEWIDGDSFYDLEAYPAHEEIMLVANEASKINAINFRPQFIYDQWAIINFSKELNKVINHLDTKDRGFLAQLLTEWEQLDIESLPHALVHGDLTRTNVMRLKRGGK